MRDFAWFGLFFSLKIVSGAVLLILSARWLPTAEFAAFSQFGFLVALLNLFTAGGLQSGVIREAAAAGPDMHRQGSVAGGALAVSGAGGLVLLLAALAGGRWISDLLVGHPGDAWLVIACAAAALFAGVGQIGCAYLTGIGLLQRSMIAQAVATLLATLATVGALASGSYALAVLAFSCGLATSLPAMLLVMPRAVLRGLVAQVHLDRGEAARLARFAATFLATAALMPAALFVLRDHYRETFGVAMLAYWLAANRISDVTTQFIGLYMSQIYVPEAARQAPAPATARRLGRYWHHLALAAGAMSAGLALFAVAPHFWIAAVFGSGLLAATAMVFFYLGGDVLRSWPSINGNHLIARRRVHSYAGLEIANVALFSAATLALFQVGPLAPAYAYVSTNVIIGLAGFIVVRRGETAWRRRGGD